MFAFELPLSVVSPIISHWLVPSDILFLDLALNREKGDAMENLLAKSNFEIFEAFCCNDEKVFNMLAWHQKRSTTLLNVTISGFSQCGGIPHVVFVFRQLFAKTTHITFSSVIFEPYPRLFSILELLPAVCYLKFSHVGLDVGSITEFFNITKGSVSCDFGEKSIVYLASEKSCTIGCKYSKVVSAVLQKLKQLDVELELLNVNCALEDALPFITSLRKLVIRHNYSAITCMQHTQLVTSALHTLHMPNSALDQSPSFIAAMINKLDSFQCSRVTWEASGSSLELDCADGTVASIVETVTR